MKRAALLMAVLFLTLSLSGCVETLVVGAAAGALGAYAASKDTVEGDTDIPYDSLWSSALRLSTSRGTITNDNAYAGTIELNCGKSRVWIKLVRLTRTATRVRISARKLHLPDLDLAQDFYVKILEQAR